LSTGQDNLICDQKDKKRRKNRNEKEFFRGISGRKKKIVRMMSEE
jgi:hypothetical protein